jgi:hypothetical protein
MLKELQIRFNFCWKLTPYDYETSYSFSTREKSIFQAVYFDGDAFGTTSFGNRSYELSGPKVSGVSPA